jgi:DNA-binding MarR family transcriptional regulator
VRDRRYIDTMATNSSPGPEAVGCTCMRLRKVTRRVTQIYDTHLAPSGLTAPQFGMLATINARPGIAIGELADLLAMDATTLTRNLRPLERSGHVAVVPHDEDRRRRVITLTRQGAAALRTAKPMWRRAQDEVARRVGAQDLGTLHAALDTTLPRLIS